MTDAEKREFMELACLAPTAYNLQHNRFLIVENQALKDEIRKAAWDQPQVSDCSLLIIMCADLKSWTNAADRWASNPKEVRDWIIEHTSADYANNPQKERDEALRSMGIAAGQIMITARAMGYDSCPIGGYDYDAVAKLINLPKDYIIGMLVPVGKKAAEPHPRHDMLPYDEAVKTDKF